MSDAEAFPAHVPSFGVHARATAETNTASAAHSRLRHVVACDQCVLASSSENSTPPTGAPNAAASPAATPALRKSLPSKSLWNASSQPPCAVICRVHRLATPAPTCTSGPSGPTGAPDATASAAPAAFTATALNSSSSGMCTPFRLAITKATPAPVAAGATNTTSAEAAAASAEADAAAAASAAAAEAAGDARRAAARAAREMSVSRARTSTVMECSMANARRPVTVPMTSVMTHFLTFAVCRPARRKLRARRGKKKRRVVSVASFRR
jgi:hypothetical protein